MSGNYMAPQELRGIAEFCDALDSLWDALTGGPKGGVSIEDPGALDLPVYDSNGEHLGKIDWSDGGAVFYPLNAGGES